MTGLSLECPERVGRCRSFDRAFGAVVSLKHCSHTRIYITPKLFLHPVANNRHHAFSPVLPSAPMKKLWDISPPVHAGSPVFPGDTAYRQQWVASIGPGCPVNVSAITLSPHVGAHADAPLHYDPTGAAIGDVDLHTFIGPCRVIHAIGCGPLVRPEHLTHALNGLPERVLVRMYTHMPQDAFDDALPAFAPETIALLADHGVRLVAPTARVWTRRAARRWTPTRCCASAACACWKTCCSTRCPRAITS